ncbi:hypothetical protein HHK36_004981 [Tetracentron sinense]|uniref:Tf2-1-like SH3-like domain-containing protein n=1 Tax=Tetracentron sinense TaxID=13715 RepID=A0A834ZKS7_TETSI|nr:hypothetical protein HHK36_004981 [Tetracentron sinense]
MKIFSWNVRGLGRGERRLDVRGLLRKVEPDLIVIQETKLEVVNAAVVSEVWDNRQVDWVSVASVGALGGQLVMWDRLVFEKLENPNGVLDLASFPNLGKISRKAKDLAEHIKSSHEQVRQQIEAKLTNDKFPVGEYYKLTERKIGSCEMLAKINDNAYQLKLPSNISTLDVFNVKNLSSYRVDTSEDELNEKSRSSFLTPRGTDAALIAIDFLVKMDRMKEPRMRKMEWLRPGEEELVQRFDPSSPTDTIGFFIAKFNVGQKDT